MAEQPTVLTPEVDDVENGGKSLVVAEDRLPEQLLLIPLHDRPLFPKMTVPLRPGQPGDGGDAGWRRQNPTPGLWGWCWRASLNKLDSGAPVTGAHFCTDVGRECPDPADQGPTAGRAGQVQVVLILAQDRFRIALAWCRKTPHIVAKVDYQPVGVDGAGREPGAQGVLARRHQEHQGPDPAQPAAQGRAEFCSWSYVRTCTSREHWRTSRRR